ncbi:RNA-directed DNA polymerase, eukaryota [Tanacetum coccineum]|uniref:RNA-directed DNA polymerase, eukaryota n=1 Tax=Tanacetum coccineum TaxID=301880 RepID=A0ABQ5GL40_9ASTR
MEGDDYASNSQDDKVESVVKNNSPPNSSKNDSERSKCSGHFKNSKIPHSVGSILQFLDEFIKVGLAQKAKKDWVRELCSKNNVNFMSFQETKMEDIELFNIKLCWGNFGFDYVYSPSVRSLGGILCVWDPRVFRKINSTISNYFVTIQGEWVPKVISNWNGDVVLMGDFNEVRTKEERHRSMFNILGADAFNSFISTAGLEEVPLGGCKFTCCHKSAAKMSKLDRFLISEGLMNSCPNLTAIVQLSTQPTAWKNRYAKDRKKQKKLKETPPEVVKGVLSCVDVEERIVVNDKSPEQMVAIRKWLPASFKKRLQYLLRSNSDVFAWTYADMTGIPRTIMVGGKPFNTEHKMNEYNHIKPIKQKKRRLGHDRNEATCKEVDELTKAGILLNVKDQTWVANPVVVKKSDGGWKMIPIEVFPGCLQRLPSNTNGQGRQRENNFLRMRGSILLPKDALPSEKCRSHVSKIGR